MLPFPQDDYVLTKLFKKSGVHSAVRHDVIEGHGASDGAILEAEATRVRPPAVRPALGAGAGSSGSGVDKGSSGSGKH